MRKPLPLQCTGWLRKLESRREMLDGASVARLQWDKHLPETAIYRSSDLQSMMFVPFSKDFCGDQYLYLLFIPTLVKILRSHCSLLPTTSSKSGFFLTPAMLTNTTSYLLSKKLEIPTVFPILSKYTFHYCPDIYCCFMCYKMLKFWARNSSLKPT